MIHPHLRRAASMQLFLGVCAAWLPVAHPPSAARQDAADPFREKLEPFIQALVTDWGIPGLAVGIVRDDEVAYARAFGVRSVESGAPLTTRSLFHMASVSKSFVATAIFQLVEQGDVTLDAPIRDYLDYFRLDDERLQDVTVRRMLQHTSGIPDTNDYGWDRPEYDDGALERYVRSLADLRLEFDPGTRWSYSNVAYEVLGDMIAKVSGVSFEEYVKEHVLGPLGMDASTFLLAEADADLRTTGHVWDLEPVVAPVYPYNRAHAPSSTLHSNVDEMCNWLRAHLERGALGEKFILEPETYEEMWRAGPVTEIDGQRMGLGWFQGYVRGFETWGHRGGDTGFRSWTELVPEMGVGVVVMSNSNMGSAVRLVAAAALDVALGHDPGRVPTPIYYVFGRTLVAEGVEAAIRQYHELRRARRRDFVFRDDYLLEVGNALIERGRAGEARDVFSLCVEEYPRSARALSHLGGAHLLLGETELAARCFEESLALDPSDERVREALRDLEEGQEPRTTEESADVVPFDSSNGQVNVPVTIEGKGPFWFIIDTGASGEGCIDSTLAEELGLALGEGVEVGDGSGVNDVVMPTTEAPNVSVGSTALGTLDFIVGNFRRPMSGGAVRLGILGLEAFQHHALAIDYPRGTVELCTASLLVGDSPHDVVLAPGDDLVVALRIGEVEVPAVVDTGSGSGFNFPMSVLDRVEIVGEPEVVGHARTRTNSYDVLGAVLAEPLSFAGHRFEQAEVRLNEHHDVAIVGYRVLKDMRVTVELFRGLARFERSPAPGTPPSIAPWPSFRGRGASGTAPDADPPVRWDLDSADVLWRVDLPGLAHSSPIVWGERVYVTTAVSLDAPPSFERATGGDAVTTDTGTLEWRVLALDRGSGEVVWERSAATGTPLTTRHEKSSPCNSTPATDGSHVVAILGSGGLVCYDAAGELLWKRDLGVLDAGYVGKPELQWGHGSSPILFENLVIVQVDRFADSFVAAFRTADGAEVWRVARDELPTWSTPTVHVDDGRAQLITNGGRHARAYDPRTGAELWSFADHAEVKVPTPIVAGDLIYLSGGAPRGRELIALTASGSGDLSAVADGSATGSVVWRARGGPYTVTPIVVDGWFYTVSDSGVLACHDAASGERLYRERLDASFSASPVAAGGRLYLASEEGEVVVVAVGPRFELLARNAMGAPCMATPALSGGLLLVRTIDALYALGRE